MHAVDNAGTSSFKHTCPALQWSGNAAREGRGGHECYADAKMQRVGAQQQRSVPVRLPLHPPQQRGRNLRRHHRHASGLIGSPTVLEDAQRRQVVLLHAPPREP